MLTLISACLICFSALSQHRSAIGTDVSRLIHTDGINVSAYLGITEKWSVNCQTEIGMTHLIRKENEEYSEHLSTMDMLLTRETVVQNSSLSFQYWTSIPYEGAYLETGIINTERSEVSHILGFGYFMPIWKGICAAVSYRNCTGFSFGVYWTIII